MVKTKAIIIILIGGILVSFLFYGVKVFAGTLSCSVTTAAACTSPSVVILRMSGSGNAHAELPSQSTAAYANNVVCCGGVTDLSYSCSGSYTTVLKLSGVTNAHVQQSGSYSQSACISLPSGTAPTVAYIAGDQSCTPIYDDTLLSMSAASNAHVGNETAYNAAGNYKICATAAGAAGTLTTDIVNASYVPVGSPTMTMSNATFSFTCQTITGSFGTASQQIYVNNNNGANNGWTLTVAAQATTNVWDSAGTDYDFNDPTGSGCTDGADAGDSVGGQMTINPSVATLAIGQCGSCSTANISKGSSAAFNEGTTNTITLLTATAASDDVGDWTLQGVSISQKVPAEQPAASDYDINMVLTVTAN